MMRGMGGPGGGVVNPGNAISHEKKRSALWKLMGLMKPYWPVVAFCCVLGIVLNLVLPGRSSDAEAEEAPPVPREDYGDLACDFKRAENESEEKR